MIAGDVSGVAITAGDATAIGGRGRVDRAGLGRDDGLLGLEVVVESRLGLWGEVTGVASGAGTVGREVVGMGTERRERSSSFSSKVALRRASSRVERPNGTGEGLGSWADRATYSCR